MKQFSLTNGKQVTKPTSKIWLVLSIVLALVIGFILMLAFVSNMIINISFSELGTVLRLMFTYPDPLFSNIGYSVGEKWARYFGNIDELIGPLAETLSMSLSGTVIGSVLAFPVAVLAAKNVIKTKYIYVPVRFLMNIFRTIPAVVLATIAVQALGGGILSGVISGTIAIALFTFGIMVKMFYEVIETVDMGPFEALESSGANRIVAFRVAILPQVLPMFFSYLLYIFEVNVRASTILGYVGAGGIGTVISANMGTSYHIIGLALMLLFAVVLILQGITNWIRGKLT